MNGAEFAKLTGISEAMVSKYRSRDLIASDGEGGVDAFSSLQLLAGHLDEDKRLQALRVLTGAAENSPVAAANQNSFSPPPSARSLHEEVKLDMARIELAQKAGALIDVEPVEAASWAAISAMKEAFDAARRTYAEDMRAELGLPAEVTAKIARHLQRFQAKGLGAFSEVMMTLGDPQSTANAELENTAATQPA